MLPVPSSISTIRDKGTTPDSNIGTRTGGIPDAVEENNGGWLIHQDAHEELENLLIKLIDDKSLAINEGRNARRRIEAKITWEHYVDQICDVILWVLVYI